MSVNSNPMDLDNWRYIYLQQRDSVVRIFEEARGMAHEALRKRNVGLPTDLGGRKRVAGVGQKEDNYKRTREPPTIDEFFLFTDQALLERSFWRFGVGPMPCFPISPPPAHGALEIPQLPPARKVAAYGSLTPREYRV